MDQAPGIINREFDISVYNASGGSLVGAFTGVADWGPVNSPPLLVSPADYVKYFGAPTTQLGYAAFNFLSRKCFLYVNRVVDGGAAKSSATFAISAVNRIDATALYYGTRGDDIEVQLSAADDGNVAHVNISVFVDSQLMERFPDVASYAAAAALSSEWVVFSQSAGSPAWPTDWSTGYTTSSLTGGDSGYASADMSPFYIGTAAAKPTLGTGLHVFDSSVDYTLDVVACPGMYHKNVVALGLTQAASRDDCLFFPDAPDDLSVDDVMDWSNGTYLGGPDSQLNTSYGALFYPWVNYYDEYSSADVRVAPSAIAAAIMANSWYLAGPYASMAGSTRGKHPLAASLAYNVEDTDVAKSYSRAGQNINWFVNQPNIGIFLNGQKTLQRTATAFDRINVRVTINQAKRQLKALAFRFVHEPNDEPTWEAVRGAACSVLDPIKAARGIREYRVICDATVNTPAVVAKSELRCKIMVKPMTMAEWIVFDWIITSQDTTF